MSKKNASLGIHKVVLTTLISSLAITGISFLDSKLWNIIIGGIGTLSYMIVGVLFSIGLLRGKKAGKEAFATVFIALLIGAYYVYQAIVSFQNWILSWPLAVKIIVPACLILLIGVVSVLVICRNNKHNAIEK